MAKFKDVWDDEVKELAKACVNDKLIEMMGAAERRGYATEAEQNYAKSLNLKDPDAMWYISKMIWRIEHDLADGRPKASLLSISRVFDTLNSDSYLENVWGGDTSSEEAQKLFKLRDGLRNLLSASV